jgi:LysM repeat protein
MIMKQARVILVVLALTLTLLITGCVQRASTPPASAGESTPGAKAPEEGTTSDVMSQLERAATQTLMALQATQQPAQTTPGPTAVGGEAQPTTEATAAAAQPTSEPAAAQPTQPPIAVPTATPGIPTSYTLQKGEHPYCIARRFNVNPATMLQLSGLSGGDTYYPGLVLRIPQGGGGFPAARSLKAHPTNYTVSAGDTIYSIACEFGDADPNAIIIANNLQSPYDLSSGQNLYIP